MKVSNHPYKPYFGVKIKTESVLEATSMKIFHNTGADGLKEVYHALEGNKFPGHVGYKGHAEILGQKIMKKYPEIEKATREILEISENNPNIKKSEFEEKIRHIVSRFGDTIDITLD